MSYSFHLTDFDSSESDWKYILTDSTINSVFITPHWQKTWWEGMGSDETDLRLIKVICDDKAIGIAPLIKNNQVISFLGSTDLCDLHDFVMLRGYESQFFQALQDYMAEEKWEHIGKSLDMGDKGFSLCLDPHDENKIWTFPMEGTDIWSRICSNGQPAVYCTQNMGKSWYRQDIGFPIWNAWFTVLSRCMVTDDLKNTGLYLGTTSGSVWLSSNSGNSWRQILAHLPKIYSLEIGYFNH